MPDRLYFTDSDAANELIARDPLALASYQAGRRAHKARLRAERAAG